MSDDEESTEEIRNENLNRNMQYWEDEKDMLIFIQMAPYPFTLEDFVWSEQQKESDTKLQHSILDGVEYIHGHDIVHRDLKPSNIFLSIHRGHYQPEGSVNITACTHCTPTSSSAEQIFLTPHIGDFGLIAKIESSHPQSENTFHPSPIAVLSSVASSRQPGTKFYCAPQSDEISPKLDVYSLGVIACELLVRFGTRSERMHVLNDVNAGRLDVLAGCELERGVRGMLEHEKERRWGCGDVRRWVGEVLGGGGGA
ncbi:putative Eukaryotic translation initiation factor 2-alpha kinase 2 [Glarea lozoyensis 74030]|uniref:Putative Eukaryotic translation initiation factor 2-alpha kinase 2 n=1 Tax=Glarea lozoyensis (strain ATCC 74030 / MF5533) TaxID=1104152 RepID=H0EP85_GLAL7|nr:putative Eukaryotic translation initiation factor 2-alpha kinase 2 [Glarea lozoyensis 74030]